jgi:FeS assembly protein IscX
MLRQTGSRQKDYAMSDLNWEATYAIAQALQAEHPEIILEDVSLDMIFKWAVNLPGFNDDVELVNDTILMSIYQEWFEERNPV